MGSKPSSTSGTVWKNLVSFVDITFLVELVKNPPYGFNIVILKSYIWIVKIYEVCHSFCHFPPLVFVSEDGIPALGIELVYSVVFYILLVLKSKLLFNFDFNW